MLPVYLQILTSISFSWMSMFAPVMSNLDGKILVENMVWYLDELHFVGRSGVCPSCGFSLGIRKANSLTYSTMLARVHLTSQVRYLIPV